MSQERESRLHTSVDIHPDSQTPIKVRPGHVGTLVIGPTSETVAIHLWGDSAKRLLRALQEAKVEEWKEVTL